LKLAALLLLAIAAVAQAGTVRLAWDASPDASVLGYRIYAGTNSPLSTTNALGRMDTGTNLTATVTATTAGRWYFIATAYNRDAESDPTPESAVVFPEAPRTLGTLAIEASIAATNWMQVYRLKITTP